MKRVFIPSLIGMAGVLSLISLGLSERNGMM